MGSSSATGRAGATGSASGDDMVVGVKELW